MPRIKINNFGPINATLPGRDGWLDIKKVTVFTGNQGSGKSTVAKLISTFMWIEKGLIRGYFKTQDVTAENFRVVRCAYHRIEDYFKPGQSEIFYEGDVYNFSYAKKGEFIIEKRDVDETEYRLPQIMYVPAERSFLSVVSNASIIKQLPPSLITFMTEYDNAKKIIDELELKLPVNNVSLSYDGQKDSLYIQGKDYKLDLMDAASGFQSLVPLYLVSWYLSESVENRTDDYSKMSSREAKLFRDTVKEILNSRDLTEEQRRIAWSAIPGRFNKSAFINIVEEPEQNLYPTSQWKILNSLLSLNNSLEANRLVFTTHSPYMISDLTIAVKVGKMLASKDLSKEIQKKINSIFPVTSSIRPEDIVIYEFNDEKGTVSELKTYNGLPSDDNILNLMLEKTNDDFVKLLKIQQELEIDKGADPHVTP